MRKAEGSKVWDSRETFLHCTGRGISVREAGVQLRQGVTVADEMGRNVRWDQETVMGLRQAKKVFMLSALGAARALLCPYLACDREDGELDVRVNGHLIRVRLDRDRGYWEDRWTRVEVPVDCLKEGENEVVFRAVGEAEWTLLIEYGRWPDRSEVSEDGGQTWRSEDLGNNNRTDGEYMVRLWLDQYAETGDVRSEPIDLPGLASEGGVGPEGKVASVRFEVEAETPEGTELMLEWRGGPTPAYDPEFWSAWQAAGKEVTPGEDVRFAQWRAVLWSEAPDKTPVLKRVQVALEVAVTGEANAQMVASDNPDLVRSSHRFAYLPADAERGERLRERWKLDEVVRGAKSEFDAFLHLRQWVREQWEDGWNMGEIDFCPPWDAMVILELASRKLSLGMCTHYATVMSHCSAALGLTARTQIMRSHCINEVWSSEHGKWVAMDVGGDSDDETKFTYHFERDGVPLSALEAHRAWVEKDYDDVVIVPQPPPATKDRFEVAKRLGLFERFMISLRNDELVTMAPGEPEHGKISYQYDGYLFWEDGETEPLPWFSEHTERAGDLYWTLNRAKIHLRQGTQPGVLEVALDTETPNLKGFEARVDEGGWEDRKARFNWTLEAGENRLEVRPVNAFDRKGTVSWVEVRYDG